MRFFSSLVCYALFRSRKFCGTFFISAIDFCLQDSNDVILPQKVTAAKTTHDDKQLERLMETIKTDEY